MTLQAKKSIYEGAVYLVFFLRSFCEKKKKRWKRSRDFEKLGHLFLVNQGEEGNEL